MKLKFQSCSEILLLLNKNKIFEWRNSEISFLLKISSYVKLMKNQLWRRNLTWLGFMTS